MLSVFLMYKGFSSTATGITVTNTIINHMGIVGRCFHTLQYSLIVKKSDALQDNILSHSSVGGGIN